MQASAARSDGCYLYLLTAEEVALLQPSSIEPAWLNKFLQELVALPLKESTYNAIARAAHEYPGFFVDEDGNAVTLATWAELVLSGSWKAPGVGPARLREVREALGEVLRGRAA